MTVKPLPLVPLNWYWNRGRLEEIRKAAEQLILKLPENSQANPILKKVIQELDKMIKNPEQLLTTSTEEQARRVNEMIKSANTTLEQRIRLTEKEINNNPEKHGFFKKAVALGVGILAALNMYTAKPATAGNYQANLNDGTPIIIKGSHAWSHDGKYLGVIQGGRVIPVPGASDPEAVKKIDPRTSYFHIKNSFDPQQEQPSQTPEELYNSLKQRAYAFEKQGDYKHAIETMLEISPDALRYHKSGQHQLAIQALIKKYDDMGFDEEKKSASLYTIAAWHSGINQNKIMLDLLEHIIHFYPKTKAGKNAAISLKYLKSE